MTLSRTGLTGNPFGRSPRSPLIARLTRDRTDGGGGGTEDEFDEEITDGDDKDGDGEDEEDEEDEPAPAVKEDGSPFTQKDLDALQLALKNARKAERAAKRNGGQQRKDDKGKDDAKDSDTPDIETARAQGEAAAVSTWKPLLVNMDARSALAEAGLIGKPDRLLKLLDLDEIDVDPDSGEIDGLEDQIEDLRKDYASLFRKRGSRRINGADRDSSVDRKKMSATELQAAALLGDL